MTFEEILQAAGLAEDKVAEVTAQMAEHGIELATENSAELKNQVDNLTAQLAEYDGKTIDDGSKDVVIKDLRRQLNTERMKSALAAQHADDVDYLLFKAEADKTVDLDAEDLDDQAVKNAVDALKTAHAKRFSDPSVPVGAKEIDPKKWVKETDLQVEPETLKDALTEYYAKEV